MHNSKLISVLKTFSEREKKKFDEFVCSPYFNKNSNATKLYRYLLKYSPDYSSEKLEKEAVYAGIFPGRSYNLKIMKNLMTELLRLAERFMEQSRYEKNDLGRHNYLLEELLNRKQYTLFSGKLKSAEELSSVLKKDENYFYNNMNLFSLKNSYQLRTSPGLEKIQLMGKPVEYLFGSFLIWYFKFNYNLLNRKIGYNFEADFEFIEKVVEFVKERSFENKDIILLYYYMFMINLKWNEEEYFYEFKNLSEKCCDMLSSAEQFNIYTAIQTHCMRMLGGGNTKYRKYFFESGRDMISKNAYSGSYDDVMHPLTYKNIAKAGAQEREFKWTYDFLNEFRNKLPEEYQNNVYNFCLAYLEFIQKANEKSLNYLSQVKYENVFDKAEVNRLLLQIYFETEHTEELYSLVDTYKHFLHNDKLIAGDQKNAVLNFVNFLVVLYKLKLGIHALGVPNQLKSEISESRTYEKLWLLQKLEEIEENGAF